MAEFTIELEDPSVGQERNCLVEGLFPLQEDQLKHMLHEIWRGMMIKRLKGVENLKRWFNTPEGEIAELYSQLQEERKKHKEEKEASAKWIASISEVETEPLKEGLEQLETNDVLNKEVLEALKTGLSFLQRIEHRSFFRDALFRDTQSSETYFFTFYNAYRDKNARYGVRLEPFEIDLSEFVHYDEIFQDLKRHADDTSGPDKQNQSQIGNVEDEVGEFFSPKASYANRWREALQNVDEHVGSLFYLVEETLTQLDRIREKTDQLAMIKQIPSLVTAWAKEERFKTLADYLLSPSNVKDKTERTKFKNWFIRSGAYSAGQFLSARIAFSQELLEDPIKKRPSGIVEEFVRMGINEVIQSSVRPYLYENQERLMIGRGDIV